MLDFNAPVTAIELPEFLDPVLSYLNDTLPHPVYSFIINILSHSLALFTALSTLFTSLVSSNPLNWDAQTILPPLISLFAAYLALLSLYRTTTWMFRTSIWFIKWGTILGALIAGVGYFMGNMNGNGVGGYGIITTLGGFALDAINGQGQRATGGTKSRSKTQRSRSRFQQTERKKPKPWERFERHQDWLYQEREDPTQAADVQKIISNIVDTAEKVVKDSGWWSVAKSIIERSTGENTDADVGETRATQKAKSKTSGSRSR